MNKREYRKELIEARKSDRTSIERFTRLLEYGFEYFKKQNRVFEPIKIDIMVQIEALAREYHEICREMVEKQIGMITKPTQPYIEWKNLTENEKGGRRFIAEKFLDKFNISRK